MAVDPKLVSALSETLEALMLGPHHPTPTQAIAALAGIAKPGLRLSIDLEASKTIGAPLVTMVESRSRKDIFLVLTRRQRQVADLLIQGNSNREIAASLGISIATVKDHVHAILQRLKLPSRAAIIAASGTWSAG